MDFIDFVSVFWVFYWYLDGGFFMVVGRFFDFFFGGVFWWSWCRLVVYVIFFYLWWGVSMDVGNCCMFCFWWKIFWCYCDCECFVIECFIYFCRIFKCILWWDRDCIDNVVIFFVVDEIFRKFYFMVEMKGWENCIFWGVVFDNCWIVMSYYIWFMMYI